MNKDSSLKIFMDRDSSDDGFDDDDFVYLYPTQIRLSSLNEIVKRIEENPALANKEIIMSFAFIAGDDEGDGFSKIGGFLAVKRTALVRRDLVTKELHNEICAAVKALKGYTPNIIAMAEDVEKTLARLLAGVANNAQPLPSPEKPNTNFALASRWVKGKVAGFLNE